MKRKIIFSIFIALSVSLCYSQDDQPLLEDTKQMVVKKNQDRDLKDNDIKLLLDKIEIVGQLEKPQAIFVLPGTNPEIDDIQLDRSFFKEIFRTVEKDQAEKYYSGKSAIDRKDYIPW